MRDALRVRPASDEYAPFYSGYVDLVSDGSIFETLNEQLARFERLFELAGADRADFRYAPDKWSVRDVITHVNDTERVMSFRALAFARGSVGPWPGMEHEAWAREARLRQRPFQELVTEFVNVRRSSISLFKGFSEDMLARRGLASGNEFTVRALIWITAGHAQHHANVLNERYLV
ncbi:MAG: hypothetical protein COV99_12095 [Bacteroidetes bacterium CG12_big_fil_rev_8_21_14_0_65_60_17]|nr:MAG: hypothetical protein COV99_12095 [Bacteroidetes bacterium CG12_big_fil_rev_8_21_14_0_65_60_17]